ncbi:MAG: hypothetical protein AVDCRST_MAG66-3079, partial [uncultured Pseudonocardia sp.]
RCCWPPRPGWSTGWCPRPAARRPAATP